MMSVMISRISLMLVLLLCIQYSFQLYMDIYPGDMRCVGQELDRLEMSVFALSASTKTKDVKQKLMAKITDPDEEDLFFEKIPLTNKKQEFLHKVEQRGVYEICFELHDGKTPVRAFFHVDYKAVSEDGKDNSRQVSKDDVPTIQTELQEIERKIKEVSLEIEHARRQEAYLNKANDVTAERIQWFSLLSIVVLLGMSAWQVIYLRRFFTSKKLL